MSDEGGLRPIPDDPSLVDVIVHFDFASDDWMLTSGGDYTTGAAEVWKADGSNWQRVVMLQWPARRNHDHGPDAEQTLRLLISPEDAEGLASVLLHTAAWLRSLSHLESGDSGGGA